MSSRKKVPSKVEETVLVSSRRRCCICFGINRDADAKPGQIAHLDKDNRNSDLDNLAFLCMEHHDEYDSQTSQRKNFRIGEVKNFRLELYDFIKVSINRPVIFGRISDAIPDRKAGTYVRLIPIADSADLTVTELPTSIVGTSRYFLSGVAFFGVNRPSGPNMGDLSVVAEPYKIRLENGENLEMPNTLIYESQGHYIRLEFGDDLVTIEERLPKPVIYGAGVTFAGVYSRRTT